MRSALLFGIALSLAAGLLVQDALARNRTEVIYKFKVSSNAAHPNGPLLLESDGTLYGTTASGGSDCDCGTIFKITPNGAMTVLHAFSGTDGYEPQVGLISDASGNLYGTTETGGPGGHGEVFRFSQDSGFSVLYSFKGGNDGSGLLSSPLTLDHTGNIYGVTAAGGFGGGIIFRVAPDGNETVLHNFSGDDGTVPSGPLVIDSDGNLYGTTYWGGNTNALCNQGSTCGVAFKLAPDGTETTLYSFCRDSSCHDGGHPNSGLVEGADGNFYGTATIGGANGGGGNGGVVFRLTPSGKETVLYSFCSSKACKDGYNPIDYGSLIVDGDGNFYGTTEFGGRYGNGTIFELTSSGTEKVLHHFRKRNDGIPISGLSADANFLHLYSVSYGFGGAHNVGAVFVTTR